MVDGYVFLVARMESWLNWIEIPIIVDDLQMFVLCNGAQKLCAIVHNIRSFVAININPFLHCGQLISQPFQPMPSTVLRDCRPSQVKPKSGNDCLIDFMLESKWGYLYVVGGSDLDCL